MSDPRPDTEKSAASELHRKALVIDSHNDSIVAFIRRGGAGFFGSESASTSVTPGGAPAGGPPGVIRFMRGPEAPRPGASVIQLDSASMRRGGIDVGFFSVDVTTALGAHAPYALDGLGWFLRELDRSPGQVTIVRQAADIVEARKRGELAAVLAVENAECLHGSLGVLRALYELGVRSIGLTHHTSSKAADGCMEARDGVGLSGFGVALVREMNELGMLVDLAHVSPGGFDHALEISSKPVIFSHGNTRAVCDHPRNLDDRQLRALAARGGVIGMSYVPFFIDAERPTLERLLDHITHASEVAGPECVGLGSDFDGGGTLLTDATEVPLITEGLIRRGFSEREIQGILGENTFWVLRKSIG